MMRILILQVVVLLAISVLSLIAWGVGGFWSAISGGLVYLVPSSLAVLLLKLFKANLQIQGRLFLWGEALKVMLSLILMLVVFLIWHQSIIFFPFLFGLFGVSHLVFLLSLRVKDYGR